MSDIFRNMSDIFRIFSDLILISSDPLYGAADKTRPGKEEKTVKTEIQCVFNVSSGIPPNSAAVPENDE